MARTMENPGLEVHVRVYEPQYIKVSYRRVATPPASQGPKLNNPDSLNNPVYPLDTTVRQDLETPPAPTGVQTPPPASAANGAGADILKQPGKGSTSSNPAWAQAHQTVEEKVRARRTAALNHPLHWAAVDDPVYPYQRREHPEHDTTDLDNLQSGDDTFRSEPGLGEEPHHSLVDRVFGPSTGEESPEHERGAQAHEQFFDLLRSMPSARKDIGAEDLSPLGLDRTEAEDVAGQTNDLLDRAMGTGDKRGEDGLSQAQKDHIKNYVKGLSETHDEKVKRLRADWEARGGRKTGEPVPVARFSPRYTHPDGQYLVPMDGNPFPQSTSTIRFQGKCKSCGTSTFMDDAHDFSDPRGPLGDHTYNPMHAHEFDMHGPSIPACFNCQNDYESYKRLEDRGMGHKAGEPTGGFHWTWQRQPDGSQKNVRVDHTHYKDKKGLWHAPGEKPGACVDCGPMKAESALFRKAETDDEFWRRQKDVIHSGEHSWLSPDQSDEVFDDPDVEHHDDDDDLDGVIPKNMSLRDHATLMRSMRWDGDERYPEYIKHVPRSITDSDGRPAFADEMHVVQRQSHITAPAFPDEHGEPHPLAHPYTYTYYPAGSRDDDGLVAGHNTVDSALRDMHQFSLWGEDHPKSQEALQRYQYVGSEMPYKRS